MPRRLVNLFLLAAVLVLVGTGLVPWLLDESLAAPLYAAHRIAGVVLVLSLVWKYAIVRGSFPRRLARRDATLVAGTFGSGVLLLVLVSGVAWSAGILTFDRPFAYSPLNVHVFAGVLVAVLVAVHAAQRWERRPPVVRLMRRREALQLLGIGAVGLVVAPALERIVSARRVTGSRHAGSFSANAFPLTIWNFDTVPTIDVHDWRLEVSGAVAKPYSYRYGDLDYFPVRHTNAVIDCTGGWWSEQRWSGIPLDFLVFNGGVQAHATRVRVVSVTGHAWTFGLDDTFGMTLATHVGGETLSPGHGYPLRLVVPGRRGFQWIKWVERIEIS